VAQVSWELGGGGCARGRSEVCYSVDIAVEIEVRLAELVLTTLMVEGLGQCSTYLFRGNGILFKKVHAQPEANQ